MTYWRLSICPGFGEFSYIKGACGCRIFETPTHIFTWHAKDCACMVCEQYVCECKDNE